ncbi:MAG TPA: aminotransferase class V-fold PLP-dependent enzyme [Acidimicrobiales bacterium]|nr:aminotransferase class V-fold PLP-dependent enzyme [Acidimicrobiales bacterium]
MTALSRRAFLARSSIAAGGLASLGAGACSGDRDRDAAGARDTAPAFDPTDWSSVRAQFPLDGNVRQFAAWILAAHPRPVAEAIARHRDGLDADTHGYLAATEAEAEAAVRSAAAEYLAASPEEIGLTDSTTQGLGLLYGGLRVRGDQEVVTTEHDFFSTHQAWALRTAATGATVRRVRLYDDPATASEDGMVSRLLAGVTPATRVVAVTWVHSGTGVKLPVRAIGDALAPLNAGREPDDAVLLCVDGIHGLGAEDASVGDLGCDFLVAGTHKWLFGPRGTGIVWGRSAAWPAVAPAVPAFEPGSFGEWRNGLPAAPTDGLRFTPGGYHSFEHRWALAEAFRFHLDIGRDRVAARTREQAAQLKAGLSEVTGVRLVTPVADDLSSGIVCFDVDGAAPAAVVDRLAGAGIAASVTPYAVEHVRLGPSIVTSPDEVDEVVAAVAGAAVG